MKELPYSSEKIVRDALDEADYIENHTHSDANRRRARLIRSLVMLVREMQEALPEAQP